MNGNKMVKLFIILFMLKVIDCAPNGGHHHHAHDDHGEGHGHDHEHEHGKPCEEEEIDFSELLKGLGIQVLGKDQESADDISPAEDHHQLNVEAIISELFSPSTAAPPVTTTARTVTSTEKLPIKSHWEGWFLSPIDLIMHNHVLEPVFDQERSSTTQSPVYLTETQYYLSKDEHNTDKFGPPLRDSHRDAKAVDLDNHVGVDKLIDKPVIPVLDTRWANYHLVNTGNRKSTKQGSKKQKGDTKSSHLHKKHNSEGASPRKSKAIREPGDLLPDTRNIDRLRLLTPPSPPHNHKQSTAKTADPVSDPHLNLPGLNTREDDDLNQLISEIFSEERRSDSSRSQGTTSQSTVQKQNPIKITANAISSNRGEVENNNRLSNHLAVEVKHKDQLGRPPVNRRRPSDTPLSHVQQQIQQNAVRQQQKQQQKQQHRKPPSQHQRRAQQQNQQQQHEREQRQQQRLQDQTRPSQRQQQQSRRDSSSVGVARQPNKFPHKNNVNARKQKSGANLSSPRGDVGGSRKKNIINRGSGRGEINSVGTSSIHFSTPNGSPTPHSPNKIREKPVPGPAVQRATARTPKSLTGHRGTRNLDPTSGDPPDSNNQGKGGGVGVGREKGTSGDVGNEKETKERGSLFSFGEEVKSMFKSVKSFDCAARKPGLYADTSTNCKRFIMCHENGRMGSFRCPRGTLFNQTHQICDWQKRVVCPSR